MSYQTASQGQVEKEQQVVKDAAHDVVQGARKVRDEGVSTPSVPTTRDAYNALDKQERVVDSLEHSYRGQQVGGKGQEVMEDVKRVIQDEKNIVRKNEGDLIQNILQNSISILHDLSSDSSMKGVFSNWQNLAGSLLNMNNASDLLSTGGQIFASLKDTEEFLHLASEMLSMLKLLVAEGQERLTEHRNQTLEQIRAAKQQQKDEIIADLVELLRALATNEIWRNMVLRAKRTKDQVKGQAELTKDAAGDVVNRVLDSNATTQLINDVRTFLQRLVGNQMNVDSFFNALAQVLVEFSENQQLADVIYEVQNELQQISNNPYLIEDTNVNKRLEDVSRRAQAAVDSLMNSPAFNRLRSETTHLMEAIKSDPTNARFVADARRLFHDIKSDQPGQLFDPALLSGVRSMIIPMFLDHLSNVPVPAISDSGDLLGKYNYTLSNIKLSLPEMLPENIHLRFDHEMDANLTNLSATNQKTFVFLEVRDIQIHLRDVAWSYQRLRTPRFADAGRVDVDTEGRGVIIRLKMELKNDLANKHLVSVLASQVAIDRFHVAFFESKHNKMYAMLTHMFATRIKNEVERAIENKMKDFGEMLNGQISTLIGEAKVKSRTYQDVAYQKLDQARDAAHNIQERMYDSKDKAGAVAGGFREQARERISETSEHAKEIVREQATRATGGEDPQLVVDEAKQELKNRGRGAVTIAAERATGFLDQQQQKIDEQRREVQMEKAYGAHPHSSNYSVSEIEHLPSANLHKETAPTTLGQVEHLGAERLPSANLQKEPLPTANLHKEPLREETADQKQERELEELRQMRLTQQAGSSQVPLAGFGGKPQTTSADIAYQLNPQISSFTDSKTEHAEKPSTQAKQVL